MVEQVKPITVEVVLHDFGIPPTHVAIMGKIEGMHNAGYLVYLMRDSDGTVDRLRIRGVLSQDDEALEEQRKYMHREKMKQLLEKPFTYR